MKDNLLLGFLAVSVSIALLAVATWVAPRPVTPTPPAVNCRLLDCDPEFYRDREVRVAVEGCEPGDGCLTYRKRSDQPPCVLLQFRGAVPDKLPAFVTGTCQGRQGTAVVVTDCRP